MRRGTIIATRTFIDAIRDAGYRGPGAALAELVDNAFEAGATTVRIDFAAGEDGLPVVTVADNGYRMTPDVLRIALQFGGSSRFGSRSGTGRYGMGLPAGSVSQAQRVDVFTWTRPRDVVWSYLDVDAIRTGEMDAVPLPRRKAAPMTCGTPSGTVVVWSRCDRLHGYGSRSFLRGIAATLGRVFREHVWAGRTILLNGERVVAVDPLFRNVAFHDAGAAPYGPSLEFPLGLADSAGVHCASMVFVSFHELPIGAWQSFTNAEKRVRGISKGAGVSVLRAGREIDYGWFFMGEKRKENYDDWWRCEVRFEPELDEFFGVTHTKQGVHPTPQLNAILTPHIERVAHELNRRVRETFLATRVGMIESLATGLAARKDRLIEPPPQRSESAPEPRASGVVGGLTYRIERRKLPQADFFVPACARDEVRLIINEQHVFHRAAYGDECEPLRTMELVLLAAARAEARFRRRGERDILTRYREHWSRVLAAFLA